MEADQDVFLLDDLPATEDAFGPHKRIADAIRKLVTTERGGKAIALIGTWGGGKSTVVKLLTTLIGEPRKEGSPAFGVFVFDAWAHEGDPLRRTFLEKFIHFLTESRWVAENKWKKRVTELSGAYKETTTTTAPQLTILGGVCAFLLFLTAAGLAMLSAGPLCPWWTELGFCFTFGPLVVILVLWLYSRITAAQNNDKADDVLGYFVNRQKEITKTQTIEAPEPTSVEFQSWFHELALEALEANRRLLIVIDNLDRVQPEDALTLWSALRTFIDFSEAERPPWADHIWVLAAFDENGLKKLWPVGNGTDATDGSANSPASTFLDKTFQLRFKIPEPLLSDWRSFLMKQLRKAFPKGAEEEFQTISRFFAILKSGDQPPTPRGIKVFINQVGAIYRTAPEPLSLSYYALYVALSETGWTPETEEPRGYAQLAPYLKDDWEEALVSLYYNMPRQEAMHVRLGAVVERALREGDADSLKQLADKRGIEIVIEHTIGERVPEWADKEPYILARAASALDIFTTQMPWQIRAAGKLLAGAAGKVNDWKTLDIGIGKGITSLIARQRDMEFSKTIIRSITASSFNKAHIEIELTKPFNWLEGLCEIVRGVIAVGHVNAVNESFKLAQDPAGYVAVLANASTFRIGTDLHEYLRPGCRPELVMEYMAKAVQSGVFDGTYDGVVAVMLTVDCDWTWVQLGKEFAQLGSNSNLSPTQAGTYTRSALRLRKRNADASLHLEEMNESGWLFYHLQGSVIEKNNGAIASLVLSSLICDLESKSKANPFPNSPYQMNTRQLYQRCLEGQGSYSSIVANPTQNLEVVNELIRQTRSLNCIEEILIRRRTSSTTTPIIDELIRGLVESSQRENDFSPEMIERLYTLLRSTLDAVTLDNLLKTLVDRGGLEEFLTRAQVTVDNSGLYRSVLHIRQSPGLVSATVKGLESLSQNDWSRALNSEEDLCALVMDLTQWGVTLGMGYQMQDSLSVFSDHMLTHPIPKHMNADVSSAFFRALDAKERAIFKKNLRDKLIAATMSVKNVVLLFSELLSDCALLETKADDLVRIGFSKMLDRCDPEEYGWMRDVLAKCPGIYKHCDADTKHEFIQRIQGFSKEKLASECQQILDEIGSLVGIKPTPKASTPTDSDQSAKNDSTDVQP